jgi:hypothetical protein
MQVINEYLALACSDGAIRFFDFSLRLEAWFEDLAAGPVSSVSFSMQKCPYPPSEAGSPGLKFWVPDFIVGTTEAFIVGECHLSFLLNSSLNLYYIRNGELCF